MDSQNPYRAPSADLSRALQADAVRADRPQRVRARRGASWVVDGFGLFGRGVAGWLLAWLMISVPYLIQMALTLFVFDDSMAVQWLAPLITYPIAIAIWGGVMYACHREPFASRQVVRGVALRWGPLIVLGVIITLLFYLVSAFIVGAVFLTTDNIDQLVDPTAVSLDTLGRTMLTTLLAFLVVGTPLLMAMWFAPALVAVAEMPPWRALRRSFQACLINMLPFALYSVLVLVLTLVGFVLMAFVMGIVIGVTSAFADLDTTTTFTDPTFLILFGVYFILVFVLGSVVWASQYLGFRDVFVQPPNDPA